MNSARVTWGTSLEVSGYKRGYFETTYQEYLGMFGYQPS